MQATTNQATPLANNNDTPLANNQAMQLANNQDTLPGATPLDANNNQAARAADPLMATILAVYTAQNITNAQSAAELAGAQSEALDATWGNRVTPQQMYRARNLSESFSAARKPPLSPRADIMKPPLSPRTDFMKEQEQNCSEIRSIVSDLRQKKEELEREKALRN